ncbi:hypothetical protein APR41_18120 [Salegentibacter salinarum]|uniref:Uncharacterized protein n=1 Tax=Salegentibacter salinarum TaxID=447422 RepID=A0A2N0TTF8_9FLAO|nr:hypothetical protein [Salegentibacter salinarum]PKD18030.1 hypothetical protein APR41_18120 [Salegentibacter salinarum]SKB99455.1 hypothetical protein SAMN05660903_03702 [Salegentibacter salinarum]
MKSKKNLYFLFPSVVLIWGALLYQFMGSFPKETTSNVLASKEFISDFEYKQEQEFSLNSIDRDPFLGKSYLKASPPNPKIKKSSPSIPWPKIHYLGSVSDKEGLNGIEIIIIDGHQNLFKIGEIKSDITLISTQDNSVTLKYKGQIKKFSM